MTAAVKERILLVDDEPQVLVALEDILDDSFRVLTCPSAERALRVVESEPDIAVIVSDQRMPGMTGAEFFARLEGRSDAARVMVTGFADLSAVVRAVNDGSLFAYVTKPWSPDDLRLVVHKGAEYFRLAKELAYERQLLHEGYSSLGYLSRLPIDALKIDRSFVIRMLEDARDTSIVTTIISLAHSLDLKVIAEGVETAQQAHLLRLLKCDQMQGYLAARPQPPEEVEKLLGATLLELRMGG